MQQSLIDIGKLELEFLVGNEKILNEALNTNALCPFSDIVISFLDFVSKKIMQDREAKEYADVITLAFWMRRASIEELKKRFVENKEKEYKLGRGIAFHIAPSNVAVNYAYSLVTGLLCGNANIVRIPSKDFPQVNIINRAIKKGLMDYNQLSAYLIMVKYGHDRIINDILSSIADIRIVWGGDHTIEELRKSPLKARATEVTFADRYSLAVIDSDKYFILDNKETIAKDFYNDTYLTDQNACTSPRLVVWTGSRIDEMKTVFWDKLYDILENKYEIQGVQVVNKLTSAYLLAALKEDVKKVLDKNNLIVRMRIESLSADLMNLKDNSGYFFEYDCTDIMELRDFCNDTRCQTVSYIGQRDMFMPLIQSGVKGIDRIVPVGKTMDFDLIWDGYNLFERLTRNISL